MKNLLIKINCDDELKYPFKGYILGIKDFCVCFGKTYSVEEIKKIKENNPDKIIFASLNRVIYNNELKEYIKILHKLDEIGLDGIIVGDIAALTYDLKTNLILDQMHLNNSYLTVKHYLENGVNGIVLTNDITKEDINLIKENNPEAILFKQIFGIVHLSTSARRLVVNYLKHFNKESNDNIHLIKENMQGDFYYVVEDDFGTHILSERPINLLEYLDDINADYFVFDSYLLKDCKDAASAFINNDKKKNTLIDEKYQATKGFINTKTIYKVKNYE